MTAVVPKTAVTMPLHFPGPTANLWTSNDKLNQSSYFSPVSQLACIRRHSIQILRPALDPENKDRMNGVQIVKLEKES